MSTRQEKNGTWTSQFRYEDLYGATKHKCKRGFATKEEADAFEADFLKATRGSMHMKFVDFVDVYAEDMRPRLKETTWETKINMIETKLVPFFGRMVMKDITTKDIIAWQNSMLKMKNGKGEPFSPTYLRTVNNQLVAILNHAERHYGLNPNPAKKATKMGSKNAGEMRFWTRAEYMKFSETMADKPHSFYAFEMLYWTGIRLGELLALTPEDFDFRRCTVSITKTLAFTKSGIKPTSPKTENSVRTIAMPGFLKDEMQDYIENLALIESDERIFDYSKSYLAKEMKRGCAKCGLAPIRIHDLRHSHVSLLIEMGFSAVAIAERMGHESADITYRYAHLFPNAQGMMADALDDSRKDAI